MPWEHRSQSGRRWTAWSGGRRVPAIDCGEPMTRFERVQQRLPSVPGQFNEIDSHPRVQQRVLFDPSNDRSAFGVTQAHRAFGSGAHRRASRSGRADETNDSQLFDTAG